MQYIEFKIVNTKLMNMSDTERGAYLDKIRADAIEQEKSGGYQYKANWNPFPKFIRDIIKKIAEEKSTKASYDDENSVFKVRIPGERFDFDDFFDEFEKRYLEEFNKVKDATPENTKWSAENYIHTTATADNENEAMRDLETYQRGAALPPTKPAKKEGE